jgi:peptide/nickel transport system permease protein
LSAPPFEFLASSLHTRRWPSVGLPYITVAWWLSTFPGAAIMVTVLGINFVGDWLRDLLDPRLQSV